MRGLLSKTGLLLHLKSATKFFKAQGTLNPTNQTLQTMYIHLYMQSISLSIDAVITNFENSNVTVTCGNNLNYGQIHPYVHDITLPTYGSNVDRVKLAL